MPKLDTIIHQPVRLQIMSALTALDEEAGYIRIEKTFIDRKPRTFIKTTGKERDTFAGHVAALQEILKGSKRSKQRARQ